MKKSIHYSNNPQAANQEILNFWKQNGIKITCILGHYGCNVENEDQAELACRLALEEFDIECGRRGRSIFFPAATAII